MKKFFENFTDKKFLMALISVVAGVLALFNIENNTISLITSLILIILPVIGYVVSEGVLDWNKINIAITEILKVVDDYIQSEKDTTEETESNDEAKPEELSGVIMINNKEVTKEKEVIYRIATILRTIKK